MGYFIKGSSYFTYGDLGSAIECFKEAVRISADPYYEQFPKLLLGMGYVMNGDIKDSGQRHASYPGNRPSNVLLLDDLSPANLGALIALYEHKVFVQGVIWNINSFDQWGVELGKRLATEISRNIERKSTEYDASTQGLMELVKQHMGEARAGSNPGAK